jgi:hypothetical protein
VRSFAVAAGVDPVSTVDHPSRVDASSLATAVEGRERDVADSAENLAPGREHQQ